MKKKKCEQRLHPVLEHSFALRSFTLYTRCLHVLTCLVVVCGCSINSSYLLCTRSHTLHAHVCAYLHRTYTGPTQSLHVHARTRTHTHVHAHVCAFLHRTYMAPLSSVVERLCSPRLVHPDQPRISTSGGPATMNRSGAVKASARPFVTPHHGRVNERTESERTDDNREDNHAHTQDSVTLC